MAVIRLILLVTILGGLTLLLAQNWSPALSLVFLGMQTQSLPLAMWILLSAAAGAFSSLFIASLLTLTNYFQFRQRPTQASTFSSPGNNPPRPREPQSSSTSPPPSNNDDWENNNSGDDDWDFNETESAPNPNPQNTQSTNSNIYERYQEPKTSNQSGSVYSYGYREPKNSGVGKSESVYDADYRVIVPPANPSPSKKPENEDDWEFLDDEDFQDKKK